MTKVQPETDLPDLGGARRLRLWPQRWRWRISIVLAGLIALAAALAWFNREQIAADLIDDTLTQYDLDASYTIESIGTRRQVITDLVMGDPDAPDLTAERVVLDISYTYGPPELGKIVLERPRLYGSFKDGKLSFGSLDPLLFAESEEPSGLPALNLMLVDGRARIESDYGVIGAKIDGAGQLDNGFEGKIAATAPRLGIEGCAAREATLYGDLTSADGKLGFDGPVRLRGVECQGSQVGATDIGTQLTLAGDFGSVEGDMAVSASSISSGDLVLGKLGGPADIAWAFDGELSLRHDLKGEALRTPFGDAANLGAEGTLRSREGFARNEWTSRISGGGIDLARLFDSGALAQAQEASDGTFVGVLLSKLERGLGRAAKGSALTGDVSVRTDQDSVRFVVPEARLRAADGDTLIALSRLSFNTASEDAAEGLTGNILTGGADLPRVNARLQRAPGGGIAARMTMANYSEGENAISVPRLEARRDASGLVRFNGIARGRGIIPGGSLRGLEMPIEGQYSPRSGFALGTRCLDAKIAGVEAYNFALPPQALAICPAQGGPIVAYGETLKVGAQLSDVSLIGSLGESPVQIAAGSATLRYPGASSLEGLSAQIGADDNVVRFSAGTLNAGFDDTLNGTFEGASAALDIVPLDLSDLDGKWSFADSVLTVSESSFTLTERQAAGIGKRLEPLQSQDASLTFADGTIRANAGLFHPLTSRGVAEIAIRHDLNAAEGRADITVPALGFDEGFQPDDLTPLTTGLIAFADGVITGEGVVEWSGDTLTSRGTFGTESFDFAAAFGPVNGVKGEIEFIDLLGMTTAPSQVATIASVNPGIEALGGRVVYSIKDGTLITLEDGRWPFMGGELILRPVVLDYGGGQGQSYIFEIVGLDAATFVSQMELNNLGASGKFDGTIPIIFDRQGNGTIQGGLLISRPPGGNVSYVGELSYEDLGTMANYAFQTLRSLDYNQMSIELNGSLAGEIVTNFNIDGVRQGEGASQNFITRQIAQLPIRFKINVRSENFYQLTQVVRGFFDPSIFDREDARQQLGIGSFAPLNVPAPAPGPNENPAPGEAERRNEPAVQPPESDDEL